MSRLCVLALFAASMLIGQMSCEGPEGPPPSVQVDPVRIPGASVKPRIIRVDWPEAIGKTAEEAEAIISKDRPDLKIETVGVNEPVLLNLDYERVRIVIDEEGKVAYNPRVG